MKEFPTLSSLPLNNLASILRLPIIHHKSNPLLCSQHIANLISQRLTLIKAKNNCNRCLHKMRPCYGLENRWRSGYSVSGKFIAHWFV